MASRSSVPFSMAQGLHGMGSYVELRSQMELLRVHLAHGRGSIDRGNVELRSLLNSSVLEAVTEFRT